MKRPSLPSPATWLPSRTRLTRRTARRIPRLLGELVIVFVGVYAAFALSEHQQERERDLRREQLRHALLEEILDITYNARGMSFSTARMLEQYDSLHAIGSTPPLQPLLDPLRVDMHMWEAALASGALELLDVPTMQRMSRFYNGVTSGFDQAAQLRQLSESMIVPRSGDGPTAFYDPETRRLRPQFAWYMAGITRLGSIADGVTASGEQLIRDLDRPASARSRTSHAALETEAQQAAEAFLRLLDRDRFREGWAATTPALQQRLPAERWEQVMQARAGWEVEAREVKHRRFHPDKVEGAEYVTLQFETRAATGRRRLESLSMVREPGDDWRVTSYNTQ